jgi:hypothetical protein
MPADEEDARPFEKEEGQTADQEPDAGSIIGQYHHFGTLNSTERERGTCGVSNIARRLKTSAR